MKQLLRATILLLLPTMTTLAQSGWQLKENSIWVFAPGTGLDFNAAVSPQVLSTPVYFSPSNSEAYTAVADHYGQLLFYTNTDTIWDRNGNPLPDAAIGALQGIGPDPASSLSWNTSQGVLILPVLDNPNRYYVFALNGLMDICNLWSPISHKLVYSIVDMTLNNGMGDIVPGLKNIPVDSALGGMMTAIPGKDCNIWLLVHDRDNPAFKAYEITTTGLSATPVISTAGNFTGDWAYKWGEMWGNEKGTQIAMVTTINNSQSSNLDAYGGVDLCDFDAASGTVSNARTITDSVKIGEAGAPWSACFSPDNSKLYYTSLDNIYQVDLSLPTLSAIITSATEISDTALSESGGTPVIRLGRDGRIYAPLSPPDTSGGYYQSYMATINNPDMAGAACNFVRQSLPLTPIPLGTFQYSLGNGIGNPGFVLPPPADSTYITWDTLICSNQDSMILRVPGTSFWAEWDDGSIGMQRTITAPGTYWVRNNNYCHYRVDTFRVKEVNIDLDLGRDTIICNTTAYTLRATNQGSVYHWQDGSMDSTFIATASGSYQVLIGKAGCRNSDTIQLTFRDLRQDLGPDTTFCMDSPLALALTASVNGNATVHWNTGGNQAQLLIKDTGTYWVQVNDPPCSGSDTIRITQGWCDCRLMVPNAFSPNNDGLNDFFKPLIENPECLNPGNYTLSIYNRWGERVYEGRSDSPGWDGTYHNKPADAGTYTYMIRYTLGSRQIKHTRKGELNLIR